MGQALLRQRRTCRAVVWTVALLAASATSAFAQLDRGTISGTIKDSQGGVVPGVTVNATITQTQQTRTTVTDGSGFYTFPNLQPGRYDISAELQGFKKETRTGVQVDAASALNLEFTLATGSLTEEVTVTSEATLLQTDVAVRKTVEAKDIEQLSFLGRNPIGVPALKAGVSGGSFNNAGGMSLTNGGFNINGSRGDENVIYVDGAIAVRTRSTGAIIGVQNADAVQEVQVLTANYMPEFGRASGGQIRFVTKSGSSRFTGNASIFYRDESLQANTWARNRSSVATENSGPAPFDYKQYGYSFGGPIPFGGLKDKLFFFGAQEWIDNFQVATNTAVVPTEAMRRGDFSELLSANNGFFSTAQVIRNPATGQPFTNNVIPQEMLSRNGMAIMALYPLPTPGFRQGTANATVSSDNPQDQRKDSIRFDYRLNNSNSFNYRYSRSNWVAIDAFRGTFPYARTDWERPNATQNFSWTSTISNNVINDFSFTHSKDDVFINVFTESGLHKRSRTGIDYPYIFPNGKEIDDKIPTVNVDTFSSFDGGPYPSSSSGPITTVANATTWVRGRHTFKGGFVMEYSGEDDFDQINVNSIPGGTNNQNGQFAFRNSGSARSGVGLADMALGIFTDYAELGERAFTKWRALATDVFVQDSWKPTANMTVEGGLRWVFWPPWYSTTNNIANFDPRYYDPAVAAVINPGTGRITSGSRYNGIVLAGDGFENEGTDLTVANDPQVLALFHGEPRGFAKMHYNVIEPRFGVSYSLNPKTIARVSAGAFHNRATLNDSLLLGGNPPFQPMVVVSNGNVDNPGGNTGANDLPFAMQAIDLEFKHPTSYLWSVGVQREVPFGFVVDATYVGRRGLYLQRERNINQLETPGVRSSNEIASIRPYEGYGVIRLGENSGNSKYNSLQLSGDRRYSNGLKVGVAYTLQKSDDNASDKRDVLWNAYDDSNYWGASSYDRRHVLSIYYIYDLPFWRTPTNLVQNILGGWQISGATFMRSGTPFSIVRNNDIAGVVGASGINQPVDLVGDPMAGANGQFSDGSDGNFMFNKDAFRQPAAGTFGNSTRNILRNPGDQQWDIALFKNVSFSGAHKMQFRVEIFNFPNHPNLSGPQQDITNANFGRSTSKDGNRRDVQLALRYLF